MSGIDFVIDTRGSKKAVVIDLKKYGKIWEDFYDVLVAQSRKHEPRESLHLVGRHLGLGRKKNKNA
ncbi:MAG: hypothetical protein ACOY3I_04725 [Verrucomicrobiota bacterium]